MVKVPAISYFLMPTPDKVFLVWFHFRLAAGRPQAGSWITSWIRGMSAKCPVKSQLILLFSQLILHKIAVSGLVSGKFVTSYRTSPRLAVSTKILSACLLRIDWFW